MAVSRLSLAALTALLTLNALPVFAESDLDELQDKAKANEWRLVKSDTLHHIKAFDRRDDGRRLHSYRLEAVLDAPMEQVARVHLAISDYPRWYWQVEEAKIVKQVSPTEFIYYIKHRAPVTLPDRDSYVRVELEPYTAKRGYMQFKTTAVPDFMPPKPPLVRMLSENITMKWTPMGKEKTMLEAEGTIDIGGDVPNWAINALQRQAPYTTIVGLQRFLATPASKDVGKTLPFTIFGE